MKVSLLNYLYKSIIDFFNKNKNKEFLYKQIFLAKRKDGFGERLRAIINAMALSEYHGLEFKFNWLVIKNRDSKFHIVSSHHSIFSKNFIDNHHIDSKILKTSCIVDQSYFDTSRNDDTDKFYNVNQNINPKTKDLLKKFCGNTVFSEMFSRIQFSNDLEIAKSLAYNIPLNISTVAIHLRAGDIIYGDYRTTDIYINKAIPYTLVFRLIEEFKNSGKNILLFGQDSEFCHYLVKKYNIKFSDDLALPQFSDEQRALFDITLMTRAETIIAGNSGFALLASTIGDREHIHPNSIYPKEEMSELTIKTLKADSNMSKIPKLQVSYACLHALSITKKVLEERDYMYLTDLGFKNDPSNYYFILLKIKYYYMINNTSMAESIVREHLNSNMHTKNFCDIIMKVYGSIDNRRSALGADIQYVKKYADLNFPMASFVVALSTYKKSSKETATNYADIYFKYKKENLEIADEVLTKKISNTTS